jgi:hypothetical protein
MKRQIRLGLSALALTAFLTGLALPGLAQAGVRVTLLAAEYEDKILVASVLAIATADEDIEDLDVAISVNGTAVGGTIEEDVFFERLGARLLKVVVSGNVVAPGQKLTAAVGGFSDDASCGRGLPRLQITAICK